MLKAIVIDDERYAREELASLLTLSNAVEVQACCANAIEGLQKVNQLQPDVIFLDISMPQISGMEMLSMLSPDTMPEVVFVSAYDEYALKAFEGNAFDYILKPISQDRLQKTIERLVKKKNTTTLSLPEHALLTQIPCAGYQRYLLLKIAEIEVAHSDHSGVHLLCTPESHQNESLNCVLSLKVLEDKTTLIRCHRQYLVNPDAIREIKILDNALAEILTYSARVVPVSRRYLKEIKALFHLS
ncbi:two-component response-regulatory protein YehT [Psychromonas sp. CNPT3]|uniref:two-component system response regulator BtsR n=1 Tax=Psychromonas sp. CNPT3 TaxID=314282 RepID=UPI00006E34CD|nr:two-component system response regulator BtsR [Psychromonas sp. CNPT3]AGH81214.1 two-component response-regulatory protein YehT [Psychromonas sp. CNPT3]